MSALLIVVMLLSPSFPIREAWQASEGEDALKLSCSSAEAWLVLVDRSEYRSSWEEASELFRTSMRKLGKGPDFWKKALRTSRDPLGRVLSRKLQSARFGSTTPGLPEGRYTTLVYTSSFRQKQGVQETLVLVQEVPGTWKVARYLIIQQKPPAPEGGVDGVAVSKKGMVN